MNVLISSMEAIKTGCTYSGWPGNHKPQPSPPEPVPQFRLLEFVPSTHDQPRARAPADPACDRPAKKAGPALIAVIAAGRPDVFVDAPIVSRWLLALAHRPRASFHELVVRADTKMQESEPSAFVESLYFTKLGGHSKSISHMYA